MPQWVLQCVKCKFRFEHFQINDVGMSSLFLLPKTRPSAKRRRMPVPELWTQRSLPPHGLVISRLASSSVAHSLDPNMPSPERNDEDN